MSQPSPWSRVKRASDFAEQHKLKALIFGASGNGKSTLGARFMKPFIGCTELQAIPSISGANPDAVVFPIETFNDLEEFRAMVRHPQLAEKFDAVVLDSFTDAQRIIVDHLMDQQKSQDQVERGTWNKIDMRTKELVRSVRDLPVHVVVLATCDEHRDESGVLTYRPSIQPKRLQNEVAQFFNCVGMAYRKRRANGLRYEVLFHSDERVLTKSMGSGDNALGTYEPPEPLWWIQKHFKTPIDATVVCRVDEWEKLDEQQGEQK